MKSYSFLINTLVFFFIAMVDFSIAFASVSNTDTHATSNAINDDIAMSESVSLEDEVSLPMHRRFLQERKLYNVISNDVVLKSTEVNHNSEQDLASSTYDRYTYNPLEYDEKSRNLDILSSSWWVKLPEGERRPETRRSHAATVYTIPRPKPPGSNEDVKPAPARNAPGQGEGTLPDQSHPNPESSKQNDIQSPEGTPPNPEGESFNENIPNGETVPPPPEPVSPDQTNIPPPDVSVQAPDEIDITPPDAPVETTNVTPHQNDDGNSGAKDQQIEPPETAPAISQDKESPPAAPAGRRLQPDSDENTHAQEYMVVTGGFSDDDWKNFPVWAYDMSRATLDSEGIWYELTPPITMPTEEYESVCNADVITVDVINGWNDATVVPCGPSARVGHISHIREGYLYVFGGLQYNERDGTFFMEQEPFMYRMKLVEDDFSDRDESNYEGSYNAGKIPTSMQWERIKSNVQSVSLDACTARPDGAGCLVNRGEVRGGYWEKEDKLVIYGGLKVRDYETSTGFQQQSDTTLGDVWAYDFKTYTWEMLSTAIPSDGMPHPHERTSHAATLVNDELVIYGGLRKESTLLFDGTTIWQQLDDVWIFNLQTRQWKQRYTEQSMGRSYQSAVGWSSVDNEGTILAAFGGYKTMTDPVDNQEVSYVYDDTLISFPPSQNSSDTSIWYRAILEGIASDTISTRLEHTAVLSSQFGNMFVWGGRYRGTNEITGLWSLNVAGPESTVNIAKRGDDSDLANVGFAYVLLVTVMMMSMIFTYMCGVIHRRVENGDEAINLETLNSDPTLGGSVFGRNGLSQDIIDTLPLTTFKNESSSSEATDSIDRPRNNSNDDNAEYNFADDDDENCCPICLVEYSEGDQLRRLPCGHEYHKECVDSWLGNQASCPACRYSLSDLVSCTTGSALATTIRNSIVSRITSTSAPASQPSIDTNNSSDSGNQPSSPRSPDADLAPGVRTVQRIRQILNRRHRISTVSSNENDSPPPRRAISPRSSDDDSLGDLELAYSSSLELVDDLELSQSYSSDGELPLNGRRRHMSIRSDRRRIGRNGRRNRRVRGGARSPLNAPLRPSDSSIV